MSRPLQRREPSASPLSEYKRTAPLSVVEGGTGESDTRLLAMPKPNDLAGAPKPKRERASELRDRVFARDNGNCASCRRNSELLAAGYRVAEEQDTEHRACQICGKTVLATLERCDGCGGRLGVSFAFRTRYRAELERRGYPRNLSRRYNGSESLWACDHVIPLWEGGADELTNLQTLCLPCHQRKTAEEAERRARKYGHRREKRAKV